VEKKSPPILDWKDISTAPRDGSPMYGIFLEVGRVMIPRKVYWDGKRWRLVDQPTSCLPADSFTKWAPIPDPELTEEELLSLTYLYRAIVGGSQHPFWTKIPMG
jgi:hypothetical protein